MLSSTCSQVSKEKIQGTWIAYSMVVDGLENETIDGNPIVVDLKLDFGKNTLDIRENGILTEDIKYEIIKEKSRSILEFGNRQYFIEKLDSEILILEEKDLIFNAQIFFKKINY